MKLIYVYAHGGSPKSDPGCVSANGEIKERDWTKDFADNYLIPKLEKLGVEVKTVQQKEWNTIDKQVNEVYKKGDIAMSIHLNAASEKATGTETLYAKGSKVGSKFAIQVNNAIVETLALKNRGIKEITREDRGGRLLVGTYPPCILTELFFLSNPEDLKVGEKNKEKLANNLAISIANFMKQVK